MVFSTSIDAGGARFICSRETTEDDINALVNHIQAVTAQLKGELA
jgi:threonine aldolase